MRKLMPMACMHFSKIRKKEKKFQKNKKKIKREKSNHLDLLGSCIAGAGTRFTCMKVDDNPTGAT